MAEFLTDPSVLTKDKLKSALVANNVTLPNGEQRKGVYVELYLKNLTAQNKRSGSAEVFSSDEEPPASAASITARAGGRKATRKTDRVCPEEMDVTELTDERLKEQLLKYGVNAGPIVASTRKVYEKKLQKLLDQGPPQTADDAAEPLQTHSGRNGSTDSDQYSDKEEETATDPEPDPEPEPVPVVDRPLRSRGKTPVTTRTRSSQHKEEDDESEEDDLELVNVERKSQRSRRVDVLHKDPALQIVNTLPMFPTASPYDPDSPHAATPQYPDRSSTDKERNVSRPDSPRSASSPPPRDLIHIMRRRPDKGSPRVLSLMDCSRSPIGDRAVLNSSPDVKIEKLSAVEQTPKTSERDVLQEMFPNDVLNTPTGISATRRRPIKGAAGRPCSDSWPDSLRPRLTEHRYTTSSYTDHAPPRISTAHLSAPLSAHLSAAPPSVQNKARRRVPVWAWLLLLVVVAGFLLFIYQVMESNQTSPFSQPGLNNGLERSG